MSGKAAGASAAPRPEKCANCGLKHRTLTLDQCKDRSMSEKALQASVVGRAKRRGWKVAHAGRGWVGSAEDGQWVTPMAKGWPDLTLAKEGHHLIFIELKRELGEVDDDQWFWLRLLNLTGNSAIIVRPSDLREGKVTTILNQGSPL